jgi:hypothetical protein
MTPRSNHDVMAGPIDGVRDVFDISHTDGEDLSEITTPQCVADLSGAYDGLHDIAHSIGYTVEEDYLPGGTNGDCLFDQRRIRVEVRNDEAQQVRALSHELSRAMRHEGFTDRAHEDQARACSFCGGWFDPCDPDDSLCQDCELSDCAYCGVTTHRPLLSENLACGRCEDRDDAA